MGIPAIRTEGLSKRYGSANLLPGLARPTAGRAESFGLDCERQTVEAHRRLAYVPGEASLWPSLTGFETIHLLRPVQGRCGRVLRRIARVTK